MFGDAMYPSKYFCWSFYANENHQDPGYDPLQIVVEECHKRQISIHAWVNPYRGFKTAKVPDVSADYAFTKWLSDSSKKGDYLVQFGEYWYFNPGVAEVAALIADDLIFNIKGVSRKTNKNNEQQSDEEYAREKIKILKNICDNRTLFIIDNFDVDADDEKLFAEFIDKAPYRVLVTTRNMQTDYKMIPVKELDDESLKSIFIKYFGEEDGRVSRDDPAFTDLFEWTDRHTLTIELIAKYMKSSRRTSSIRSMLDTLSDKHLAIFSEVQKRQSQKNSYDRIRDILRISDLCEDDQYFLRCLSLMPASGIRYLGFFEKWIHRESDNELFWDNVLDKHSELGIVKENKNSGLIYLHPIVREVVLNELKPSYENCKDFVNRCAMVGEDVIPLMYGLSY